MRLTKFAYYLDIYLCLALIALMAVMTAASGPLRDGAFWLCYAVLGGASWTLVEYAIHRWVYHFAPYFADLHGAHHDAPKDYVGAPPVIGILLILAIFYLPLVSTSAIAASGVTAGVLAGYACYMTIHHAAHYWKPSQSSPLYAICRHHALHHYRSEEGNFGITTTFWDHAFGTAISVHPHRTDPQLP